MLPPAHASDALIPGLWRRPAVPPPSRPSYPASDLPAQVLRERPVNAPMHMASTLLDSSPIALGILADALRELSMTPAAAHRTGTFDACRWLVGKIGPCSAYRLTMSNLLDIFHIVKGFPALHAAVGSYPDEEARAMAAVEASTGEGESCRVPSKRVFGIYIVLESKGSERSGTCSVEGGGRRDGGQRRCWEWGAAGEWQGRVSRETWVGLIRWGASAGVWCGTRDVWRRSACSVGAARGLGANQESLVGKPKAVGPGWMQRRGLGGEGGLEPGLRVGGAAPFCSLLGMGRRHRAARQGLLWV